MTRSIDTPWGIGGISNPTSDMAIAGLSLYTLKPAASSRSPRSAGPDDGWTSQRHGIARSVNHAVASPIASSDARRIAVTAFSARNGTPLWLRQ